MGATVATTSKALSLEDEKRMLKEIENWLSSDENRGTKRRILRIYDDDDDNDENSSQGMEYSQDATASRNKKRLCAVADDLINWRVSPSLFNETQGLDDNDDHQDHSPESVQRIADPQICNRSKLVIDGSVFFNRGSLRRQILEQIFSIPSNMNSCNRLAPMARHVFEAVSISHEYHQVVEMMIASSSSSSSSLQCSSQMTHVCNYVAEMDSEINQLLKNLRSIQRRTPMRSGDHHHHHHHHQQPAVSMILESLDLSPFASIIKLWSRCLEQDDKLASLEGLFQAVERRGFDQVAKRAKHQIELYGKRAGKKDLDDGQGRPPPPPPAEVDDISQLAYFFTFGASELALAQRHFMIRVAKTLCGSIEEYLICADTMQGFLQGVNDAFYSLAKTRRATLDFSAATPARISSSSPQCDKMHEER